MPDERNRPRDWPLIHQLLLAAAVGGGSAAFLAVPWPWDLAVPGAVLAGLLVLAASSRGNPYRSHGLQGITRGLRDDLLLAGFLAGVVLLLVSGLVSSSISGQPWLSPPASLAVQGLVVVLGISSLIVPTRPR